MPEAAWQLPSGRGPGGRHGEGLGVEVEAVGSGGPGGLGGNVRRRGWRGRGVGARLKASVVVKGWVCGLGRGTPEGER